jgi:hypothetical protein
MMPWRYPAQLWAAERSVTRYDVLAAVSTATFELGVLHLLQPNVP